MMKLQDYDILLTPTLQDVLLLIGEYRKGQEGLDGLAWVDRVFGYLPFTAIAVLLHPCCAGDANWSPAT
jgi:hypothetical protein